MKIHQVIVVDDHPIFLRGLTVLLNEIENVKVIAQAENGKKLIDLLCHNKPDIIFMDIKMGIMNGVEATKKCLMKNPHAKIVALTMFSDSHYINDMIEAGAVGFLSKDVTIEKLQEAIDKVLNGETYFPDLPRNISAINLNSGVDVDEDFESDLNKLTDREAEILRFICDGFSTFEIAQKLFISPRTVERHRSNLLAKTNKKNTAALVKFAIANDYV